MKGDVIRRLRRRQAHAARRAPLRGPDVVATGGTSIDWRSVLLGVAAVLLVFVVLMAVLWSKGVLP